MENEAILSSRKMKFYTRIFFRIIRCVDSITFLAIIIYHYFNRFRANNFLKKKNELQRIVKIFKQFEISSSKHFALRKSELTGRNGVLARKEKVVAKKGGGIERKRGGRSIEFGARGSPFFFFESFSRVYGGGSCATRHRVEAGVGDCEWDDDADGDDARRTRERGRAERSQSGRARLRSLSTAGLTSFSSRRRDGRSNLSFLQTNNFFETIEILASRYISRAI